uniref:Uncharacterized protein n=1 Tax=Sphaerodactylus townsendi TaxID=933632 RepID=A0ACB8GBJ4_9SAUR
MNLDSMAADIGFDMRMDAVLGRTEQLIKLEGDTLTENKIMARNLQRKLKIQKEQLHSKELHVKLLHQKIIQLEEEKQVRTALAVERDDANLTVRKLQKKLERLQKELILSRETNTDLKTKLADVNELKIRTLEQDRTIEDLSKSQEKLEKIKAKTEKQLNAVKSELHVVEREAKEDKEQAKNMLESVTSELSILKTTLEEVMKRERQRHLVKLGKCERWAKRRSRWPVALHAPDREAADLGPIFPSPGIHARGPVSIREAEAAEGQRALRPGAGTVCMGGPQAQLGGPVAGAALADRPVPTASSVRPRPQDTPALAPLGPEYPKHQRDAPASEALRLPGGEAWKQHATVKLGGYIAAFQSWEAYTELPC